MPDSSSLPKSMLSASAPVAFVPITDKDQALAFYRDQLGLTLLMDQSPFALVFDLNGTMLRATFIPAADFKPQQFTVLGWHAPDIEAAVEHLQSAGVALNNYPWIQATGPLPIWTAPGGTRIAWFNDPFGNVLSLQSA